MSATTPGSDVESLRLRAEQALGAARPKEQVCRLLEDLAARAPEASQAACFAHRNLAELRLQESPWAAALHLRKLLAVDPDDDIGHALMGLSQALQGHYKMAVASFRRAVSLSPSNPWYRHNLGHLLDVALDNPSEALQHLRRAHRAEPFQEEVGASLAHCLGRLGECAEALSLAHALLEKHPGHRDLRLLVDWLEKGAPARNRSAPRAPMVQTLATQPAPELGPLESALAVRLERAETPRAMAPALGVLWRKVLDAGLAREKLPPAAWVAAMVYALERHKPGARRQRELAQLFGVGISAMTGRYQSLKTLLRDGG
ncbi:MAG: hypothetical protein JNK72_18480 [Myxococcales bacterium]|nr:hypothetical protein [Myxococcales bacterium]